MATLNAMFSFLISKIWENIAFAFNYIMSRNKPPRLSFLKLPIELRRQIYREYHKGKPKAMRCYTLWPISLTMVQTCGYASNRLQRQLFWKNDWKDGDRWRHKSCKNDHALLFAHPKIAGEYKEMLLEHALVVLDVDIACFAGPEAMALAALPDASTAHVRNLLIRVAYPVESAPSPNASMCRPCATQETSDLLLAFISQFANLEVLSVEHATVPSDASQRLDLHPLLNHNKFKNIQHVHYDLRGWVWKHEGEGKWMPSNVAFSLRGEMDPEVARKCRLEEIKELIKQRAATKIAQG